MHAGSAVALPVLARRTAAAGLTGFEWAVGVPGSIGGAVRMNAGGHGSDIAACLVRVEIFDLHAEHCEWRPADALGLRFRGSDLADHEIVLTAQLDAGERRRRAVRARDRRDRALASREPARRAERRLGVRQPDSRASSRPVS